MKIKTITCHRVYNYGASLQAYALQHYLEKQGNEVEIIDFWPYFFHNRYNFFFVHPSSPHFHLLNRFPFFKILNGLKHNRKMFKTYGRKQAFDRFEKKYLKISDTRYLTSDELKQNAPKADIYIAGSDQIWNTNCPNGHQAAYYLDFGAKNTIRATYAASFGVSTIPEEYKYKLQTWIQNIDVISIRETSGLQILQKLGFNNAVQVIDPVFLLNQSQWKEDIIKKAKTYSFQNEKYILLYDFIGDKKLKEFALNASKEFGYMIISLNDFISYDFVSQNVNNAGPCEFVSLIANASLVITNSFHATAFSVILQKEFYTFSLANHNNSSRMEDFCSLLGLIQRYNASTITKSSIDYKSVTTLLNSHITQSKKFIQNILTHKKQ